VVLFIGVVTWFFFCLFEGCPDH